MNRFQILSSLLLVFCCGGLFAQKIVTVEYKGQKYEVLDMTQTGKITWGGYEEIGAVVRSESNGTANTKAIVLAVGDNKGFEGKPYAAKLCANASAGGKTGWYLPSKNESEIVFENREKFNFEERITLWTSTEASGTQAVSKYLYTGAFYDVSKVDEYHFVCIRKVE